MSRAKRQERDDKEGQSVYRIGKKANGKDTGQR